MKDKQRSRSDSQMNVSYFLCTHICFSYRKLAMNADRRCKRCTKTKQVKQLTLKE